MQNYTFGLGYWILVIPFAGSLAIDLFVATLSKFRDEGISHKNWSIPLGITHGLFPAGSFFLFWSLGEKYPNLQNWLGLIGFILISLVIYEILHEEMGKETKISITDLFGYILNLFIPTSRESTRYFVLVMSVSWDALLCAPVLIPLAEDNNWDVLQIAVALITCGIIAGVTAAVTLQRARKWRKQNFHDVQQLVRYQIKGSFWALSVIGGFGMVALGSFFETEDNVFLAIMVSTVIMMLIFTIYKKPLRTHAEKEAHKSIYGVQGV